MTQVISTIVTTMRTVNISDLKAQLSAHIQLVKDGEEVLEPEKPAQQGGLHVCAPAHRFRQRARGRSVIAPRANLKDKRHRKPTARYAVGFVFTEHLWKAA